MCNSDQYSLKIVLCEGFYDCNINSCDLMYVSGSLVRINSFTSL